MILISVYSSTNQSVYAVAIVYMNESYEAVAINQLMANGLSLTISGVAIRITNSTSSSYILKVSITSMG